MPQKINETKKSKIYYIINNKYNYILYLFKSNLNNIDFKFLTRLICLSARLKLFQQNIPLTHTKFRYDMQQFNYKVHKNYYKPVSCYDREWV